MRAFAVGAVLLFHGYCGAFPGAWIGVDMFFVLSGFLITSLLVSEIQMRGTIALGSFYLRRALRLTPAFAVMLCAVAVFEFLIKPAPASDAKWSLLMAATYMMNWNMALAWGNLGPLAHCWSLSVEEQFYLVWPVLLLVIPAAARLRATIWLLALVVGWKLWLVGQGVPYERVYAGFDTHSDSLLVGCCLAQLTVAPGRIHWLARRCVVPVLLLAGLALTLRDDRAFSLTAGILLSALCTAWIILASTLPGRLRNILTHAVPVYVGRISYGIYLWHAMLLHYATDLLPPALNILPALLAIPIAAVSFHAIEQPILRLRGRQRQSVGGGLPFGGLGFFTREREA